MEKEPDLPNSSNSFIGKISFQRVLEIMLSSMSLAEYKSISIGIIKLQDQSLTQPNINKQNIYTR